MSERSRKDSQVDVAHDLQIRAAALGAAKYTMFGGALVLLGHFAWPAFRRQTPAFKTFLVTAFTMYGAVVDADQALFKYQSEERSIETALRRQALIDLGRQGVIATESEITKWKNEHRPS